MSAGLREQIAKAIAKAEDADYWVDEIRQWEALEQWERDAHPEEYPGMAYEDRESFLRTADAVLPLTPAATALDAARATIEAVHRQVSVPMRAFDDPNNYPLPIRGIIDEYPSSSGAGGVTALGVLGDMWQAYADKQCGWQDAVSYHGHTMCDRDGRLAASRVFEERGIPFLQGVLPNPTADHFESKHREARA